MQYFYGERNILRALDEAEFWKRQEAEHTMVIQLVTPDLEEQYVKRLNEFDLKFNRTLSEVVKYIESAIRSKGAVSYSMKANMLDLISQCITESKQFMSFLGTMLRDSKAVLENRASQTVINHIIRESQYSIGIEQLVLE